MARRKVRAPRGGRAGRCFTCKKRRPAEAYADNLARTCEECRQKRRCIVCDAILEGNWGRKTCGGKCLETIKHRPNPRPRQPLPKTRVCSACNKRQPLNDNFYRKHNVDGFQYYCKSCQNAYQRDRYQTREQDRERARAATHARYVRDKERRKHDPEFDALYRERRRLEYHRRQERLRAKQIPPPDISHRRNGPEFPAKPLAEEMERIAKRRGETLADLCKGLGIWERTVFRWRTEDGAVVREGLADEILTQLGLLWTDVWSKDQFPKALRRLAA